MSVEMFISVLRSLTSSSSFNEGRKISPLLLQQGVWGGDANVFPSLSLPCCCKTANLINLAQLGTSLVSLKAMFSIIVYDTTCYILVIFPLVDHQSTVKHCSRGN